MKSRTSRLLAAVSALVLLPSLAAVEVASAQGRDGRDQVRRETQQPPRRSQPAPQPRRQSAPPPRRQQSAPPPRREQSAPPPRRQQSAPPPRREQSAPPPRRTQSSSGRPPSSRPSSPPPRRQTTPPPAARPADFRTSAPPPRNPDFDRQPRETNIGGGRGSMAPPPRRTDVQPRGQGRPPAAQPGGSGRPPGARPGGSGRPPGARPIDGDRPPQARPRPSRPGNTGAPGPRGGGDSYGGRHPDSDGYRGPRPGQQPGYGQGGGDRRGHGGYRPRQIDSDGYDPNYHSGQYYQYDRNRHRDRRRWEWSQRRRDFYRDHRRHTTHIILVSHLNRGWSHSRYYGHYGPSSRWRYHRRYYDYGYDRRQFSYYDQVCRYDRNGDGAVVGALLGAIIGGAAAHDDDVGVGILLGAGFGALLGSSVDRMDNCDRAQFQYGINYAFEYGQPYYWANPHSGMRGTIIVRETYYYGGAECRWGDAEIYMPDGTYNYERVRMCRDAYGDWQVARHQ